MKKILLTLSITLLLPLTASAAGISVDYPGAPGPLFNITNIAPGDSFTKTVTVKNDNSASEKIGVIFKSNTVVIASPLADIFTLDIKENSSGAIKASGTLKQFYLAGEIELGTIPAVSENKYNFIATFSPDAGNEYQGVSENFDLTFGFIGTPAPPPSPTPGPGPTIGGVVAGTFRSLGISEIAPGEVIGDGGGSPRFDEAGVAGATTEKKPEEEKEDEQKETGTAGVRTCAWWMIIAILLALTLIFYGLYLGKEEFKNRLPQYWYVWPGVFGVVAWLAHYFLHDAYRATWFCNWFWLVVLAEASVALIFYKLLLGIEKAEEPPHNHNHF